VGEDGRMEGWRLGGWGVWNDLKIIGKLALNVKLTISNELSPEGKYKQTS